MKNLFKTKLFGIIGLLSAILFAPVAQASVASYDFSATIYQIQVHTPGVGYDSVSSASLSGSLLEVGNHVNGGFVYDTATPKYDTFVNPGTTLYLGNGYWNGMHFAVAENGLGYQSGANSAYLLVTNYAPGEVGIEKGDGFGVGSWNSMWGGVGSGFGNGGLSLFDTSNALFDSNDIPSGLSFASFDESTVYGTWYNNADGSEAFFLAHVDQLSPSTAQVPEPGSYALLLLGLGCIVFFARKKSIG